MTFIDLMHFISYQTSRRQSKPFRCKFVLETYFPSKKATRIVEQEIDAVIQQDFCISALTQLNFIT